MRIEEHLALAGELEFIQCGQVDGAQGCDLAVQSVDFALKAADADVAFLDGFRHGLQVGLRIGQQCGVLLQAQARCLFLELELGDAGAQRVERAFELHAALVAGAQLGGEVVVFTALGGQGFLALHLRLQRLLQAALRRSVGQAGQLVASTLLFVSQCGGLLGGGFDGARQLAPACLQTALRERGLLRLALQRALLFAAGGELALGFDHAVAQLGLALLAVGQLHIEFFKACLSGHAALLQVGQLRLHLGQVAIDLLAAGTGLLGQLGQAQGFHLQLMGAALRFGRFASCCHQALRGVGVGRLCTDQGGARFVGDQGLGAQLFFEVLDLLRAGEQAGLFGVLCVKTHAVGADGMACGHKHHFARLKRAAAGERVIERGRGIAALQPVNQHGAQAGILKAQQVRQAGVG